MIKALGVAILGLILLGTVVSYRLKECQETVWLAVEIHAGEDAMFECARVKCDMIEKLGQYVSQMYALFDAKAEQCLGRPLDKPSYGQGV